MSRKNPPSFDFYPDDFIAGTRDMVAAEVGIYFTLLCWQFSHGSIPNERMRLKLICGNLTDEEYDLWMPKPLSKFPVQKDGEFRNERMALEREKKIKQHSANIRNGRKGGRPKELRKQKEENPNETQGLSESKPNGKKEVGSRKTEVGSTEDGRRKTERFDQFWESYPPKRRRDKKAALKAYAIAVNEIRGRDGPGGDDPEAYLVHRARAYAESDIGKGEFSKMPTTWLNKGSYDDDPDSWRDVNPVANTVSRNMQTAQNLIARLKEQDNGREG